MSSVFSDQAIFMEACGQTTGIYNEQQFNLYKTLIKEEVQEFYDSTFLLLLNRCRRDVDDNQNKL